MEDNLVEVEVDDGVYKIVSWPMCAVSGCKNGCYLRLNSKYCYPHTNFTGLGVGASIIANAVEPKTQPTTTSACNAGK